MFHLGFSYVGLIYLIMLFIPNGIWTKNKPQGYDEYVKEESKVLGAFERVGQVLVTGLVLIFSDTNIRNSKWAIILGVSFVLMILYEIFWIRYFRSPKKMKDYYASILGIPVAGATLPVLAFILLGIYGSNIFLIVSSIILGIGHIGIHLSYKKEIDAEDSDENTTKKKRSFVARLLIRVLQIIIIIPILVTIIVIGIRNVDYIGDLVQTRNGVLEDKYVTLGGQEQYILIRGNNIDNPVIVYLHGGPTSPDAYVSYAFVEELADNYTVIAWDQRGCGRTYERNKDTDAMNSTATFEQACEDVDDLVDYACERFGKEKVIIMGWSYGTILGCAYVSEHPEKVSEYVGIGQFVNMEQNEKLAYETARNKAKASGADYSDLDQAIVFYTRNKSMENMMYLRRMTAKYNQPEIEANMSMLAVLSPYFNMDDFNWFSIQNRSFTEYIRLNKKLFDVLDTDITEFGTDYQVPMYFVTGSMDYVCNGELAEEFMNEISAPKKELVYMEGCSHSTHYDRPAEFAQIINRLLE